MGKKQVNLTSLTIPQNASKSLSLFISVVAAQEGASFKTVDDVKTIGKYALRRGNIVPGVLALDNNSTIMDVENLVGTQPVLRTLRELFKSSEWAETAESLWKQANKIRWNHMTLRAIMLYGSVKLQSLASVAYYMAINGIKQDQFADIMKNIILTEAVNGTLAQKLIHFTSVEVKQTRDYLTLTQKGELSDTFKAKLLLNAEKRGGYYQFKDIILWPSATVMKSLNSTTLLFQEPLPVDEGEAVGTRTVALVPIQDKVNQPIKGDVVRVGDINYIIQPGNPTTYIPLVDGGAAPVALKEVGTAMKPIRVIFHAPPTDIVHHLIALQAASHGTAVDFDNGTLVDENVIVYVGPSKPGDVVVSNDEEYIKCFSDPQIRTIYNILKDGTVLSLYSLKGRVVDKILPVFNSLITWLTSLSDACGSVLSALISCLIEKLMGLQVKIVSSLTQFKVVFNKTLRVVTNVTWLKEILQPLSDAIKENSKKIANVLSFSITQEEQLIFTEGGMHIAVLDKSPVQGSTYSFSDTDSIECMYTEDAYTATFDSLEYVSNNKPTSPCSTMYLKNGATVLTVAYDGDYVYPKARGGGVIPMQYKVGGLKPILITQKKETSSKKQVTLNEKTTEYGEEPLEGKLNGDKFTNPQGPVKKLPGHRLTIDCQLFDEEDNQTINEEIHGSDDDWTPIFYDKESTLEEIEQLVEETISNVLTEQRPDLGLEMTDFLLINAVTEKSVTTQDIERGNITIQVLPLEEEEESDVEYEEDDPSYFDNGDSEGAFPIVPLDPIPNFVKDTPEEEKLSDAGDAQSDSFVLSDEEDLEEDTTEGVENDEQPAQSLVKHKSVEFLNMAPINDEENLPVPVVPGAPIIMDAQDTMNGALEEDIIVETDEEYISDSEQTVVGLVQHSYTFPNEAIIEEQPTKVNFHVGDLKTLRGLKNAILVNAANERLTNGGGIAKAISDLAGAVYQSHCNSIAPISKPVLTLPYDLAFFGYAGILHVVPPRGSDPQVKQALYDSYASIFTKPAHYVIPVLGAGIFGCNPVDSLQALQKALPNNIGVVTIISIDPEHKRIWEALNATIVTYTYDMDQLYTGQLNNDQIVALNLFDGQNYTLLPTAGVVYLAVTKQVQTAAEQLGLTMQQYYSYLEYCSLTWTTKKTKFVHLNVTKNNCFISAVLDFIQQTHIKLRAPLDGLMNQFLNGNASQLVAWCYAVTNQKPGDTGDAISVLAALMKYNKDTITAQTQCCMIKVNLDGMIFTARMDDFKPTVHCIKCNNHTGLTNLDVPGVVVAFSSAALPAGTIQTKLPTLRHIPKGVGHWFAATQKSLDGSQLSEATIDAVYFVNQVTPTPVVAVDSFETSNRFSVLKQDPLPKQDDIKDEKPQENTPQTKKHTPVDSTVKVLDNPDTIDILDLWIEKPTYVMVNSFKLLGTALFATGKVVSYSAQIATTVYNYLKAAGVFHSLSTTMTGFAVKMLKDTMPKPQHFKFLKSVFCNYTMNIVVSLLPVFMLLPVTSIIKSTVILFNYFMSYTSWCADIHAQYNQELPYNLESFCYDRPLYCMPCLSGKDSIHFYKHLQVEYSNMIGWDLNVMFWSFSIVFAYFKPYEYFVTNLFVFVFNWMEFTLPFYGVYKITYFNTYIAVLFTIALYKSISFLRHVNKGCNKPGCVICAKKNVSTQVTVETIIQGRKFYSTVSTNGGKKFCEKHNFYCVNCQNPGEDDTFIPVEAVESLSKIANTHVKPTSVAYAMARDIESNGDVFMANVSVNGRNIVTCNKYTDVRTVDQLKKPELLSNYPQDVVIACDFDNVASVTLAKQMAVVMSMVLKRFILIIDQQHTKPVNNFERVKNLLSEFFSFQDLTQTGDLVADIKNATNNQVSDSAICAARFAADNGLDMTMDNPNNIVPHYAFDFNSLPSEDKSLLVENGVASAVLKGTSHNSILPHNLVSRLSVKTLIKLKSAAVKNGVKFLTTPSTRVMRGALSYVPFTNKTGGSVINTQLKNLLKLFTFLSVLAIAMSLLASYSLTLNAPTHMSHIEASSFRVIRNGVIDSVRAEDDCFSNKYVAFDSFIAREYKNSPACPVVIANVYMAGDALPGMPGHVFHRDGLIMHAYELQKYIMQQLFESPASTWNAPEVAGYTQYTAIEGSYINSIALFNSKCMYLTYNNERELYCYDNMTVQETLMFNNVSESITNKTVLLYSDIKPHVVYKTDAVNGKINDVIIPEQLWYWPYFVKFTTNRYCRVGECLKTNPGYCLSFVNKFIVNNGLDMPGVFCGETIFQLVTDITIGTVTATDIFKSSTALMLSTILIIAIVFLVMLFQRIFKQYTSFVGCVVLNAVLHILGIAILTLNSAMALVYFGIYFYVTLTLTPLTRSIIYVFMFVTLTPHVSNIMLLAVGVIIVIYNLYKYIRVVKYTASGNFASFSEAAKATFVLNNEKYVELMQLAGSDYDNFLASHARYRYFSGTADSAEYNKVCMSFLAKAMDNFKNSGGSVLYTPPKLGVVQAGIKKLLSPSGIVEKCMVSVYYRGQTLNGIWLNNVIYCPRHILGKYKAQQWHDAVKIADTRDFVINSSHSTISFRPVGLRLNNAVLQIVLSSEQNNPNTPDYEFATIKPGSSMTIACTYDGIVASIYQVVMQTNGLIYASFLNGACGSVGYAIKNGKLLLYYMHHLEFNNKTHGGSDLNGQFYGNYVDEEIVQNISSAATLTDNALSQIYAHLSTVSTKPKWLASSELSVKDFNEWAQQNDHTLFPSSEENHTYLDALARSTGVSIPRVLATLVNLHKNWGSASVLGMSTFDLDLTPEMVYNQAPIILQGSKIKSCMTWFVSLCFNFIVYATALFYVVPNNILPFMLPVTFVMAFCTQILIKHTIVYMMAYCLPLLVLCVYNTFTIWVPNNLFRHVAFYIYTLAYEPSYAQWVVYVLVGFVILNACASLTVSRSKSQLFYGLYNFVRSCIFGYTATMILDNGNITATYLVCFVASFSPTGSLMATLNWYIADCLTQTLNNGLFMDLLVKMMIYHTLGFVMCMRFGIYWWFNKFTGIPVATYKFLVSSEQLKYMMATKMSPPKNFVEVIMTNMKLAGVGGTRDIAISTVQNKTLDIKATAVVIAQLLEKVGATNKTDMCKIITNLHNKVLQAKTPEEAEPHLYGLLVHLLPHFSSDNLDKYFDSLLQHKPVLQVVGEAFMHLESYKNYKDAQQVYDELVERNAEPSEIKKALKAVNVAKAEYDRDVAAEKKLAKLADAALKSMYLAERSEDRKAKLTSGLTAMLYHMLRRVNSDKVNALFELAKSDVVPLHAITGSSTDGLKVIIGDEATYKQYVTGDSVVYKGRTYTIHTKYDLDNQMIQGEPQTFPIVLECTKLNVLENLNRIGWDTIDIKLQNNELYVRNVFCAQATCLDANDKAETGKTFYVSQSGQKILVAVTSSKDNLRTVTVTKDDGSKVVLNLEQPLRFAHVVNGKNLNTYLYFVASIKTIYRGMIIGHISSTVTLQASGTAVEQQENASLLTYLAFSANPKEAYLTHIRSGGQPIVGAIKMIAPQGEGFAVTTKPQPNANQIAYGGASICLYCRAHVPHPSMDGRCSYKGRFVHIDKDQEPIQFALTHEPCTACHRWVNHDCTCNKPQTGLQTGFSSFSNNSYLNE